MMPPKRRPAFQTILLAVAILCTRPVTAQTGGTEQGFLAPAVVLGHPFSAIKYTRTVQVQPNGRRIVKAEGHHILLDRDREGRIFLLGADQAESQCDVPSLGKMSMCDAWGAIVFDPSQATMWHWMDGEIGDKTQLAQMDPTKDQIAEAERLTSAISTGLSNDPPETGVKLEELGERNFGGIRAKGARVTTTHAFSGSNEPRLAIYEVWVSADYRLVLRVIDGDPAGEETVSGLSHISLSPSPSLFQPPLDRTLRHWKDGSKYVPGDLEELSLWMVK